MIAATASHARSVVRGITLAVLVTAMSAVAFVGPARADFGIASFDGDVINHDADGTAVAATQAGSHPEDVSASIVFNSTHDAQLDADLPDEPVRDIRVDLPVGFVGNPTVLAQCREPELESELIGTACPADSQVGVTHVVTTTLIPVTLPVFNMVPSPGVPAVFGFKIGNVPVHLRALVRSESDYGLSILVPNINQAAPVLSTTLTFWGVPADPVHDRDRGAGPDENGNRKVCADVPDATCTNASGLPQQAFLTNPMTCNGPVETVLHVTSWFGSADGASFLTHRPAPDQATLVGPDGCDRVPFDARLSDAPAEPRAGAPTGFTFDLDVAQSAAPHGIATSHLKKAVVHLPAGVSVSPSAADGLGGCPDAATGIGSASEPRCPDSSKIGTVTIDTPLLEDPLRGEIFLRQPKPGNLFRLLLVARGRGVLIKVPGEVHPDLTTGRLTAIFDDNPQLPFSNLHLAFKGGPRAPLTLAPACGTYTTTTQLTSWSGRTVTSKSSFDVSQDGNGAPCPPQRFTPDFTAGTINPVAGTSSAFVMAFGRPDGQAELGAINGSLPPGLLGVLASVPLCGAAQGAAGTCPASSRVGRVQVAAGTGGSPVWLPVAGQPENSVYLTEPYRKGDVAGMSIVTRAVAGPFDLGTVVTKVYLKLRPKDQGIDVQSERLPRILAGVPLNIRRVVVTVDRPGFMVNPTSCRPMATYANVFSQSWAKAPVTSRFQVGGCASLSVSPVIQVSGGGKGDTGRYEHPALRVSIRQSSGQAHLSKTNVVLPKALNVDLKAPALKASCPRDVYAKDECSPVATVGTVRAVTPLLREPLQGPAFLIQKKGQLPDIVMRLRNNRMSLDLIGVLDFLKDGRLITRVKGIPDAALSSFVLTIKGGRGGSLLNRSDLCARKRLTKATFKGQNGKLSRKTPVTHITGCASKASTLRAASRRAVRRAGARASAARHARAGQAHQRAAGGRS